MDASSDEDLDEDYGRLSDGVCETWRREMQRRREQVEDERREAGERNAARVASLRQELAALPRGGQEQCAAAGQDFSRNQAQGKTITSCDAAQAPSPEDAEDCT